MNKEKTKHKKYITKIHPKFCIILYFLIIFQYGVAESDTTAET